jgi:hypothetical protein
MKKSLVFLLLSMISLNSYSKPSYHYYLKKDYNSTKELFSTLSTQGVKSTNNLFKWCCDCISYYAELTGFTYEEMNIILFVIGQPLLILFFLSLFLRERFKRKSIQTKYRY